MGPLPACQWGLMLQGQRGLEGPVWEGRQHFSGRCCSSQGHQPHPLVWERGWSRWCWMGWPWSWVCPPRVPAPTTGISFSFLHEFNIPQSGQVSGGVHCMAWGQGEAKTPKDGQGTPIPEASLRNSWCLSSVITGLIKAYSCP